MSDQITSLIIQDCHLCNANQNFQSAEPLKPIPIPDLLWTQLGCYLFDYEGEQYMVLIDYYSKFIQVETLPDLSSATLINALKTQFARHEIPEKIRTDNGPQYSSSEFDKFCREYEIQHVTSSLYHPQSNEEAERAVQIVKRLWRKCTDKYLALLDYRTTPLASCNLSPAQLLMGRLTPKPDTGSLIPPPNKVLQHSGGQAVTQTKPDQTSPQLQKAGQALPTLHPGDPVKMAPLQGTKPGCQQQSFDITSLQGPMWSSTLAGSTEETELISPRMRPTSFSIIIVMTLINYKQ